MPDDNTSDRAWIGVCNLFTVGLVGWGACRRGLVEVQDLSMLGRLAASLLLIMPLLALPQASDANSASNAWSETSGPLPGLPRSIGGAAHGCLVGALALPTEGPGYQAI